MKRLFLTLLILCGGMGLKAQCPLHEAVDFTVNDCSGTEIHLFDILDGGQYVLIDFFYTTCGGCNKIAPMMMEAYQAFGCNRHDVVFLEVDDGDSEQACLNWINQYGIEYPTLSGAAGGTNICDQYFITSFPTVILIAPDRSIVIRDLWPLNSLQNVIDALEEKGLEQHDCTDGVADNAAGITLFPNPANGSVSLKDLEVGTVSLYNVTGQKIDEFQTKHTELTINTAGYENGVYLIKNNGKALRFVVNH